MTLLLGKSGCSANKRRATLGCHRMLLRRPLSMLCTPELRLLSAEGGDFRFSSRPHTGLAAAATSTLSVLGNASAALAAAGSILYRRA